MSARGALYDAAAAAVAALTAAARAFAAAAQSSLSTGATNTAITLALDNIVALTTAAIPAIRAASSAPEAAAATQACEQLLYQCQLLASAVLGQFPTLNPYVVGSDAPLVVILEGIYGTDAVNHLDEAINNNPAILGLVLIPAGATLQLSPPGSVPS